MKIFGYLILALFLCHCATVSKEQCEKGNWQQIGMVDGKKGRDSNYIRHHEKSCSLSTEDKDNYEKARLMGLIQYCGMEGGYYDGLAGKDFNDICTSFNAKEFEEGYLKGRNLYLLRKRKAEVSDRIAEENERIDKDESVLNHAVQAYNLISGRSPTESLDREEEKLSNEIYEAETALPARLSVNKYPYDDNMAVAINSLGALTGTVFGFGLGHVIQGRYKRAGWQWTVADTASIAAMVVSSNSFCNQTNADGTNTCSNALPTITALGFIGMRVWQSINLWSHLKGSEYSSNYQISLSPQGFYVMGQF